MAGGIGNWSNKHGPRLGTFGKAKENLEEGRAGIKCETRVRCFNVVCGQGA